MSRTPLSFAIFMLLVSPILSGCSGGSGGEFPTTPVTIKVVYKGQPVEGASVAMVNANDHGKPVIAVGRTDAQGEAKMRTYADADGAVKGSHLVTITKMDVAPDSAVADVSSEDYNPNVVATAAPKSLIPAKYSTPASGLTVQVADSPVSETFELVD
jgi:hypothetical protein